MTTFLFSGVATAAAAATVYFCFVLFDTVPFVIFSLMLEENEIQKMKINWTNIRTLGHGIQ